MAEHPDDRHQPGGRISFARILDASLSVTFLVLAAYIAFYASKPGVPDSRNLLYFSALMGAYGIWRMIRTVLKNRGHDDAT
ncbi:MAG: hypothetical protein HGB00_01980 [Chlorobiaceae bacterium]|nr:hypothetical protein [Chlorobiaceae bacterium]